jgi:hypothetical protein
MNVTYRAAVASAAPDPERQPIVAEEPKRRLRRLLKEGKVARISCCCRISELLPLVRQLHDEARALNPESEGARAA